MVTQRAAEEQDDDGGGQQQPRLGVQQGVQAQVEAAAAHHHKAHPGSIFNIISLLPTHKWF